MQAATVFFDTPNTITYHQNYPNATVFPSAAHTFYPISARQNLSRRLLNFSDSLQSIRGATGRCKPVRSKNKYRIMSLSGHIMHGTNMQLSVLDTSVCAALPLGNGSGQTRTYRLKADTPAIPTALYDRQHRDIYIGHLSYFLCLDFR